MPAQSQKTQTTILATHTQTHTHTHKKRFHHKQLLTKAKTTGSSNMLRPRKKSHCSVQAPMGITKNHNSLPQNPITDKQRQYYANRPSPWNAGFPLRPQQSHHPASPKTGLRERSYSPTALQRWRRGGEGQRGLREDDPSDDGDGQEHREELDRGGRHGRPALPASGGSASRRPDPCLRWRRHGLPRTLALGGTRPATHSRESLCRRKRHQVDEPPRSGSPTSQPFQI